MKVPEDTQILTDDEVRRLNEALMSVMPVEIHAAMLEYGINPEDTIRMRSLGAMFRNARAVRNETLKETSIKTKIPQYRIWDIETAGAARVLLKSLILLLFVLHWCKNDCTAPVSYSMLRYSY